MADRHLNIDSEILKQVQDDTLVGGHDKIRDTYFPCRKRFVKNDSIRDIQLHTIQSIIEASCRTCFGISETIPVPELNQNNQFLLSDYLKLIHHFLIFPHEIPSSLCHQQYAADDNIYWRHFQSRKKDARA